MHENGPVFLVTIGAIRALASLFDLRVLDVLTGWDIPENIPDRSELPTTSGTSPEACQWTPVLAE
jgi:hypothetical protein